MALAVGDRLDHLVISGPLGAGGTGEARTAIDGVFTETRIGVVSNYSVSDEGTLAYLPGTFKKRGASPVWVGLNGVTKSMPIPDDWFRRLIDPYSTEKWTRSTGTSLSNDRPSTNGNPVMLPTVVREPSASDTMERTASANGSYSAT